MAKERPVCATCEGGGIGDMKTTLECPRHRAAEALLEACHDAEARILAMLHGEPMKNCSETLKVLRRAIMKAEASR